MVVLESGLTLHWIAELPGPRLSQEDLLLMLGAMAGVSSPRGLYQLHQVGVARVER